MRRTRFPHHAFVLCLSTLLLALPAIAHADCAPSPALVEAIGKLRAENAALRAALTVTNHNYGRLRLELDSLKHGGVASPSPAAGPTEDDRKCVVLNSHPPRTVCK